VIETVDGIVSLDPFVAQRRVGFQDCDPAGVVFAGNFYDFSLWAYDLYRHRALDGAFNGVTAPMKACSFVHRSPLWPDDTVRFEVTPLRVGQRTFTLKLVGTCGERAVFDVEMTLVCKEEGAWRSRAVPAALRAALISAGAVEEQSMQSEDVR
jgi:4-hydroxybenzoyl-CoA thioesterase